ncbi:MAG: Flp pilus assembly complex ATPase component TadA [Proteobacteria bacterium]|nr:Flp pilus assembly complex ATPase component TadA [Pseudomonadota bacterium]
MERRKLGEILVDAGVVDEHQLEIALAEHRRVGGKLGRVLTDLGLTTEEAISRALASQTGVDHYNLEQTAVSPEAAARVPEELARRRHLIPVSIEGDTLVVAMANPTDIVAIDEIERHADLFVRVVSASRRHVFRAIDRAYRGQGGDDSELERAIRSALQESDDELDAEAGSSGTGVIALVYEVLSTAARRDVTDVHFEPDQKVVRIRYRIDGDLVPGPTIPGSLLAPIVARVKVMASLNIAETRVPQDGKIRFSVEGRVVDLRISTFPTVFGESVVIRVLDSSAQQFSLDRVGMNGRGQEILREAVGRPNGLILAVGPTGSGKTTTLYALLRAIDGGRRKVITLEDPVEYGLALVTQCQVNEKAGLTFAAGLRAILRHDPDVVLLGEMRDAETVSMALRASLTGHLVLSTLHTNDAVRTVSRLRDMGAAPFLLASCLTVIVAQRLVRTVCDQCVEPYEPSDDELLAVGIDPSLPGKYMRGIGCDRCNETGSRGREAVFEILSVTPEISRLIGSGAGIDEIEEAARRAGMESFRAATQEKASEGRIALDEIARVSVEDL